jgi:thiamine-phosphate diphosphorylase
MTAKPAHDCRLYLITPPRIDDLAVFGRTLAAALDAGDVAALQIRLKDAPDDVIAAAVEVLGVIARSRDVAVILNDRPDLAARLGCDGVHVGQSDASCAEARRIMGKDAMIGVTCHDSRHLAMEAAEAGADYVAFGAFFPTTTKEVTAQGGSRNPVDLAGDNVPALRRHRRDHGRQRGGTGGGGRGLPGGQRRGLGPSARRRRRRAGAGRRHRAGIDPAVTFGPLPDTAAAPTHTDHLGEEDILRRMLHLSTARCEAFPRKPSDDRQAVAAAILARVAAEVPTSAFYPSAGDVRCLGTARCSTATMTTSARRARPSSRPAWRLSSRRRDDALAARLAIGRSRR